MLTGRRAFAGETIVRHDRRDPRARARLDALPADTPRRVRELLRRCLEKDPRRVCTTSATRGSSSTTRSPIRPRPGCRPGRARSADGLAGPVDARPHPRHRLGPRGPRRPDGDGPRAACAGAIVVATPARPSLVAMTGTAGASRVSRRMCVRRDCPRPPPSSACDPSPLTARSPVQENAATRSFSPDGRWIGFTTFPDGGSLKRMPVDGGAAVTVVDDVGDGLRGFAVQGVTWERRDRRVRAMNPRAVGLWRVTSSGGQPQRVERTG